MENRTINTEDPFAQIESGKTTPPPKTNATTVKGTYTDKSQGTYTPEPPKKKSGLKIILIILVLAAAAAGIYFVLKSPDTPDDGKNPEAVSTEAISTEATTEAATETASTQAATTEAATTEATTQADPTTDGGERYAADGDSTFGDFLWFTENVYYQGAPKDAEYFMTDTDCLGTWKAMIFWDPDMKVDSYGMEFGNAEITGNGTTANVKIDWLMIHIAEETHEEDGSSSFSGEFTGKGINVTGPGSFKAKFYELNGKQYGFGKFKSPDGTPAAIAFVRP